MRSSSRYHGSRHAAKKHESPCVSHDDDDSTRPVGRNRDELEELSACSELIGRRPLNSTRATGAVAVAAAGGRADAAHHSVESEDAEGVRAKMPWRKMELLQPLALDGLAHNPASPCSKQSSHR